MRRIPGSTITVEAVQRTVAEQLGMKVAELKLRNNSRAYTLPRQVGMYLAKRVTNASLLEIGEHFGRRSSAVSRSIRKIGQERLRDENINHFVQKMLKSLSEVGSGKENA